jgi:hypothetical protein
MIAVSEVKGMMANEKMHHAVHGTAHGPDTHNPTPGMAPVIRGGSH